jgi:hypothetical protein
VSLLPKISTTEDTEGTESFEYPLTIRWMPSRRCETLKLIIQADALINDGKRYLVREMQAIDGELMTQADAVGALQTSSRAEGGMHLHGGAMMPRVMSS